MPVRSLGVLLWCSILFWVLIFHVNKRADCCPGTKVPRPLSNSLDETGRARPDSETVNQLCQPPSLTPRQEPGMFTRRDKLCVVNTLAFDNPLKLGAQVHSSFFFFWLHPWHVEAPGPEIKPTPQQPPELLQWKRQILNLLHHKGTPNSSFLIQVALIYNVVLV